MAEHKAGDKSVADAYAKSAGANPFSWSLPTARHRVTSPTDIRVVTSSEKRSVPFAHMKRIPPTEVGIVGAGMSGLYAGLLLKKKNISFRIFEGREDRIGGRVYTCREKAFGEEENQYFEAGAMRLPCIKSQDNVFNLINYLNRQECPGKPQIDLIDYHYKCEDGNLVYVNGTRQKDGKRMTLEYANKHPKELGFDRLKPEDAQKTADSLMDGVMQPLLKEFVDDRKKFMEKYGHMSLRYYLGNCAQPKWYPAKINYVETMTSGTNAFTYGLMESVIEYQDFNSSPSNKWKTIKNGMSRLPDACAAVIGKENITMGAVVYNVSVEGDKVALTYSTDGHIPSKHPRVEKFDKVLLAIPNPVLRMIERPLWSTTKEEAIRACNIQPTYKLGLQFNTRFWEKVERPAKGGQSTTDTPSRWIVYPSYGIGDPGKGILLTYCWSTDALSILPASDEERKDITLRDLQKLYPDVNIREQFTGKYKSVHWASLWSAGVADFLPGQFTDLYSALQANEGNIYFAGEHISARHGWIVGALDSAGYACKQMFPDVQFDILK